MEEAEFDIQGVPKKCTFRMLLEPEYTGSITSSWHPLCLEMNFLVVSTIRISLIKPSQVMFMVKFSPTALKFGYDFVLIVHFFGHPV